MKKMTNKEYQEFLETINTLPKKEYETIKRGVLQLNDDKKRLLEVISELQQRIDKAIEYIRHKQLIQEQVLRTKNYNLTGFEMCELLEILGDKE